jgi:hypothetical protein
MNTVRLLCIVALATITSAVQASEITNFVVEPSVRSRAEVRTEARTAPRAGGELYDGRQFEAMTPAATSREAVRRDTMAAQRMAMPRAGDYIGG